MTNVDEKGRNLFVKDVEFRYVRLDAPFKGKYNTQYEMAIVIPADRREEMEANHLKVKEFNGELLVNLKRGEKQEPPRVIDGQKNVMPVEMVKSIGNGSRGTVKLRQWKHDYNGGGIATMIDAVQVVEYKEYTGGDDGFDMIEPATPAAPAASSEDLF